MTVRELVRQLGVCDLEKRVLVHVDGYDLDLVHVVEFDNSVQLEADGRLCLMSNGASDADDEGLQ